MLLDLSNTELSSERSWRGPRSQQVGERGAISNATLSTTRMVLCEEGSCLGHFDMSLLIVRAKSSDSVRKLELLRRNESGSGI